MAKSSENQAPWVAAREFWQMAKATTMITASRPVSSSRNIGMPNSTIAVVPKR